MMETTPKVNFIVANSDPNRVTISVVDDGPEIFERARQVLQEGEESAVQHSLGLGLWTTNWLVSELSGDLRVMITESKGTTVTVTLPATGS